MQLVAVVYALGDELTVVAPSQATGEALDWLDQCEVRQLVEGGGETILVDVRAGWAMAAVKTELQQQKKKRSRTPGKHPDGLHCDALICKTGHVQSCDGTPFDPMHHCTLCGAVCQDECRNCLEPIRGAWLYTPASSYKLPRFCHGCGQPYPWTQAAKEKVTELINTSELNAVEKAQAQADLEAILTGIPSAETAAKRTRSLFLKMGDKLHSAYLDYVVPLGGEAIARILKP